MPVPFMVGSASGSFPSLIIRQLKVVFAVPTYETFGISSFPSKIKTVKFPSVRGLGVFINQNKTSSSTFIPASLWTYVSRILKSPSRLSNRKHLIYGKTENCYSCKSKFYLHYRNQIKLGNSRGRKNIRKSTVKISVAIASKLNVRTVIT